MKFSDSVASIRKLDISKVKIDTVKPWISNRITEALGFEDDIVIDFVMNQLTETTTPDPKQIQINLTGFLTGKVARDFLGEL